MDATVAGLVGALLGAAIAGGAALGAAWMQQSGQARRDRLKSAADLGLADFTQAVKLLEKTGGSIAPLAVSVAYHAEVLEWIAKGKFDSEAIAKIDAKVISWTETIANRPNAQAIREARAMK